MNPQNESEPTCRCHRLRSSIARAAIGIFAALAATAATAGQFSVTPVRIFMAPQDRAIAITLTNEGNDELLMQADVYLWKQKPGGEEDLTMSEDLFLSPPIVKLAPKAKQVVRLAMLKPPKGGPQQTYRVIVREVPEAKTEDKKVQVQIALAFSLPIFITPPGAQRQVQCSLARSAADEAKATCENSGTAYAQIREFVLQGADGAKLAQRDAGGYILPGISRAFELKAASGKLPAGKAKLTATFDDGAVQTFDVALAD